MTLEDLNVGDTVFIRSSDISVGYIFTMGKVAKVTQTRLNVSNQNGAVTPYRKNDGYEIGGSGWHQNKIFLPEEIYAGKEVYKIYAAQQKTFKIKRLLKEINEISADSISEIDYETLVNLVQQLEEIKLALRGSDENVV